ncbi:MAG: UbiA family prenyltransferase [Desulfatiglandaceae bacterium]
MKSIPRNIHVHMLRRLKLFLALSRTPHGILDLATPALAALLWLGGFPRLEVALLGALTAFAGYTAVYALNDLMDIKTDKLKLRMDGFGNAQNYLDAVMGRHPVAQGLLSLWEGIVWAAAWAMVALAGAYWLNPICVLIFLAGCFLELIYCLMLKVSPVRSIISGAVKTSGGIAAVFAVDPHPSPSFLAMLFLFLFFWEVGGQNIPADWNDIEEGGHLKSRTIPVKFGPACSSQVVIGALLLAMVANLALLRFAAVKFGFVFALACVLAGVFLLLIPAWSLVKGREREQAMALFNRASYYPMALLLVVTVRYLV